MSRGRVLPLGLALAAACLIGVSAATAPALAALAEAPADAPGALGLYVESQSPAAEYEATVSVQLPVGSGSFEVVGRDGGTFVRPRGARAGMRQGQGRGSMMGFEPEAEQPFADELLRRNYLIEARPGPTVLGRETWEVSLSPRWPGSPSRRVVVDRVSRVRLVVEDRNHSGRLLQRREVLSVKFGPGQWSVDVPRGIKRGAAQWFSLDQAGKVLGFRLGLPGYLPPGYRLIGVRLSGGRRGTAHLVFFDGLGVISLYQTGVPWWARPGSRHGVDNSGIEWTEDGVAYYLVGDIPLEDLKRIAESVK